MTMNTQLNAPRELSLEEMEMVSGGKDIEVIDAAPPRNPPANENNFGAGGGSSGGTGTSSSGRGAGSSNGIPSSQDYFDASDNAARIATAGGIAAGSTAGASAAPLTVFLTSVASIFGIASIALDDAGKRMKATDDAVNDLVEEAGGFL